MKNQKEGFKDKGLLSKIKNKIIFSLIILVFGLVIILGIFGAVNRERERLDLALMK